MARPGRTLTSLILLAAPSAAFTFASVQLSSIQSASVRLPLALRGGVARDLSMQIHNTGKQTVSAVTFDLDDTLYACMPVIMRATQKQFDYVEEHYPNIKTDLGSFRAAMKRQRAQMAPEDSADLGKLRRATIAHVAQEAGYNPDEVAEAVMEVFCRERNNVDLFDDVPPTLENLKSNGLVLGGITNGNADFKEGALKDHLQFCVSSGALGKPKPAKEPFLAALELCGVDAGSAVHVGDDIVSDVVGAHEAGMRTVWFNPKELPVPEEHQGKVDATITSINQLPQVLRAWEK